LADAFIRIMDARCINFSLKSYDCVRVLRATAFLIRSLVMTTGTVKWFNPTKGFGFIQPEGGAQDVFVHISEVERAGLRTLNEGQEVSFEVEAGRNGKKSAVALKVA